MAAADVKASDGRLTLPDNLSVDDAEALSEEAHALVDTLSEVLADARHLAESQGGGSGSGTFKVHNVPAWPQARFAAWLKRQKVALTVRRPAS